MSEHRRRPNPGGEQPQGGRAGGARPYAYGTPPDGAPSYDRPTGVRETAQQPRMTRAEMRKQSQKSAKGSAARSAESGPPAGRGGGGGKGGGGKGDGKGGGGRRRFIDYPRFGKSGIRRWLPSWKLILTTFLILFGGGVAAVGVAYQMTPIPDPNKLLQEQNNIYYWADGSEMTRKGTTNRQLVELKDISEPAQKAVVAAENESFWSDSGIDPKGMARAVYNMASGGQTQGGSTITQQYVKNAYLSQDQTVTRKVKELFITLKINQEKGKPEILTGYLNTSWFGRGATGIQAAAQAYYGVDAKNLDICQSAMLAGLLKGATYFDPTLSESNRKNMQDRWTWILGRMVITKSITQADRDKCGATFPKPIDKKAPANMNGEVSYLVDLADKFLVAKDPSITQANIDRGGYQIYTTFQKDKVAELKKAVEDVKAETLDEKKRPGTDKFVQVGAASVVPGDGAIVAIYGGDGVEKGHYTDNADTSGIPVGSTFKPFVLATAMQYGVLTKTGDDGKPVRISTDSRYLADNMSQIYKPDGSPAIGDNGQPYHQRNDDPGKPGYVTLKEAMRNSYNVPFVQLGQDVGGSNSEKMAIALGLRKESLAPSSSLTFPLGTSTPSAIRMASAYSVFAARGQQVDPYSVTKVVFEGNEKPAFNRPKSAAKSVLDQAVADNITDVLQNVAENGTGKKGTKDLGRPVAGKTGTTDAGTSAWWVGYTPQLATSVGMWREEPGVPKLLTLDGTAGQTSIHGGDFPTEIFTRYMKDALADQKAMDFPTSDSTGQEVDASGAPSTASAAPPAVPSTSPSPSPSSTQSPSSTPPTHSPDPTTSPSTTQGCGFFDPLCGSSPSPSHSRSRPGRPSTSPSTSSSATDAGGNSVPGN
ncbi:transglycosylase domain-containing protein [Kitasatospora sp. GP82]|uniref:transglycosylase domain-containing protein n=1 Tax=Kitasatospora sp. GP82 TaxID=3035089 RepID=UPI00247314AE|nr:transglycosylase domain-containing protein [Kitasatospora sp. GP82]MDH6127670.1 membrane peptidoglycan carboxypeptidase [Kitasatospora sp. GP82]